MTSTSDIEQHLAEGLTTVARAWAVTRKDGVRLGFTDHDCDLEFDNLRFRADTGLSARAVQQATGLSVDNTEAMGGLSSDAISEDDIAAGRYDSAEVLAWLVNWADVGARKLLFRGTIGEVRRGAGAFHAELRGLTETLNRPVGRVYQRPCGAVLGDQSCGFDLTTPGYVHEADLTEAESGRVFSFANAGGFEPGWFQRGRFEILSGAASGLFGAVKRDRITADGVWQIELWEPLRANAQTGDSARIIAGCDKRFETCQLKFNNILNFQGFPDIPEDDWMMIHPTQAKSLSGGSRR